MPIMLRPPREITKEEKEILSMIVSKGNVLAKLQYGLTREVLKDSLSRSLGQLPLDLHLWLCQDESNLLSKLEVSTYPEVAKAIQAEHYTFDRALDLNYNEDRLLEELVCHTQTARVSPVTTPRSTPHKQE